MDSPRTKTCKVCSMQIPAAARMCPYCRITQRRRVFLMHPLVGFLFMVGMFGALVFVFHNLLSRGEPFAGHAGELAITESRIVFGEENKYPCVGVIGTVRNGSAVPWKEIRFHVEFRDAKGSVVDVGQSRPYRDEYEVPAGATLAFEVSFPRKYAQAGYVSHTVRIVAAKDARAKW
jgi:predicted nucleic acid-binding Zn ribbon protein